MYQAITGSHRIEAARALGIDVPVVLLPWAELDPQLKGLVKTKQFMVFYKLYEGKGSDDLKTELVSPKHGIQLEDP
jgi:hypothetical protein